MQIYHDGKAMSADEIKEVLGSGYDIQENNDQLVGYITVKKISCRLYEKSSLESNCVCFLTKNGVYGVVEKNGNYVKLEGGGYVYLDGVSVEYTSN